MTCFLNVAMNLIPIITDYLKAHRRLVIPQLGAFIRKSEGDEVVFSEMLKRDDGVLRALLIEHGLGEIEAAGQIDRFIFDLRHTVADGSVYRAEGLGLFARGENGTIRFRYLPLADPAAEESVPLHEPEAPEQPSNSEIAQPADAEIASVETTLTAETAHSVAPSETKEEESPAIAEEATLPADRVPEAVQSVDEKRSRIKQLLRFSDEHPREHRSSSQPRRQDPSVRGLRYGKPQKSTDAYTYVNSAPSRRPDTFIILAVLAVVIALGAILYGYWNDRRKERLEQEYVEQTFLPTEFETQE